jgi:hypothetical protein
MSLKALSQFDYVSPGSPDGGRLTVWAVGRQTADGSYIVIGNSVAKSEACAIDWWGTKGSRFVLPPGAAVYWDRRGGIGKLTSLGKVAERWYAG